MKLSCKVFGHNFFYYRPNLDDIEDTWKCKRCDKVTKDSFEAFGIKDKEFIRRIGGD